MLVSLKRIPYQVFDNFPLLCATQIHSLFPRSLKPQVLWLAIWGTRTSQISGVRLSWLL